MVLVLKIDELSNSLPEQEKFGLRGQINRATIPIPSGSAFEMETQLLIIQKLKFIINVRIDSIIDSLHEGQKMIKEYMKS